jgi:hypothetical protein
MKTEVSSRTILFQFDTKKLDLMKFANALLTLCMPETYTALSEDSKKHEQQMLKQKANIIEKISLSS